MTTILTETIGSILDNYADVIEGGNSYRGSGTAYNGIPGTGTYQDWVRDSGTGLTVDAGVSSKTAIELTGVPAGYAAKLITTNAPPFFILATTATNSGNTGAARKISAHDGTVTFTTAAFPDTIEATDTVSILEGFKRAPDNFDIEAEEEGIPGGFDRFFSLRALPGVRMTWHGNDEAMYRTTMDLRVRFLKYSRARAVITSAFQNVARLVEVMCRGAHRGDYAQVLTPIENAPEILTEDQNKIVIQVQMDLIYRYNVSFL